MAKTVRYWSILSLFLLIQGYQGLAQLVRLDSVKTEKKIISYSADRTGNIFVALERGTIVKYDPALDSSVVYNPTRVGDFDLIEAWHGFQVFAFNRKFQDFVLLDRFLTRENRYSLGNSGLFFIDLATISSDQNLWLFEENGLRLVRFNFRTNEAIVDVVLDPWLENTNHEFVFMREYQNMLFLTDKEKVTYVFDNLGNFIRKLNTGGASYLTFSKDNLYYLKHGTLVEQSLYSEKRHEIKLANLDYSGVLVFNQQAYLISSNKIERFLIPKN